MEFSNGLLVAIMFVVILSMGIGGVLGGLADIVNKQTEQSVDKLHASWMVLLLLAYFNLFWHTIDLLAIESWGFGDFVFVMAGPILIFFATTVLIPKAPGEESHYFAVSRRFFTLLAITQVWVVGADFVLGNGLTAPAAFNAAFFALFVVMARSQRPRLHMGATVLAWAMFLTSLTLRGFGVIA